eukprot:GHVS01080361.1.p1 GENE.GHVS01080361.1~~GHVS01080361.1.p1  ORF type:complete len:1235 (-),score=154.80 GHVS01080361.1:223-3927(-)
MPVLYSLSLQRSTAVVGAVHGSFSAPRVQELIVSHSRSIELLRPDDQGKLHSILLSEVFGVVRSMATFRLAGGSRDYLVIGSDSGRLVVLDYNSKHNRFDRLHCETFGKTGVRRIVPGEYIAVDPKGRAMMIGALERQKFVYVINRDAQARLTISSPLEAHKTHIVCHALTGVDMGFENPVFASLEQSYDELDRNTNADAAIPRKGIAWWEMDLGLNHVVKKLTMPVDITAHALIPVPGGGGVDGPSGVIVCCENFLVYRKPEHEEISCALPRRLEMGQDKGLLVSSHAVHKMKDFFFILIQSEYGDLYKVELRHENGVVLELQCRYFDTVPVANALCVLKSGHLFVAAEFANHQFYQFTGIGTSPTDPTCTSAHPHGKNAIVAFKPRALRNLSLSDELLSLSPTTALQLVDVSSTAHPQIFAACGRGPRSSLRVLQHGLGVEEMADNELPGKPKAVWTVKHDISSDYDGFIIVSFEGNTLVLSIGDTVEEVTDTSFLTTVTSIHVHLMFDNSFIQVHESGIRHILDKRIHEWRVPSGKPIVCAASNNRQLAVCLSGGEIISFQVEEGHHLTELGRRDMGGELTCLSVQPLLKGRLRSQFLAVAGLDNVVRILSLDRDKELKQLAMQALPASASPESICLLHMEGMGQGGDLSGLFLNVGLSTGVMLRSVVDTTAGTLSDQRTRFLGGRAVSVHSVSVDGSSALLALSESSWLCYIHQGTSLSAPLNYDALDFVASFSSEQCPDGFVAISGNSLRIFTVCRLGETFSQQSIPLSYTPRAMTLVPHPNSLLLAHAGVEQPSLYMGGTGGPMLAVVECDHNVYDERTRAEIRSAFKQIKLTTEGAKDGGEKDEGSEEVQDDAKEDGDEELREDQIGTFKAGPGKWGSCLRIINPMLAQTLHKIHMNVDEAAVSCCACELEGLPCLVVGTTFSMSLTPHRVVPGASIRVYTYDNAFNLTLLHTTPIDDYPFCFAGFHGRLLAGIGSKVRIFSLGKQRLLRKCEYKNLPEAVTWMRVCGDRIFVGDIRESFHVLKYGVSDNLLYVLCDDSCPRWLTCGEVLDYHTVIGADKFDSIFINRVPSEAKADEIGDVTGLKLKGDSAYITGKVHKFEHHMQFHLGDTVMAMSKGVLTPGGAECIIYGTMLGAIGALTPFLSKEEMDLFHHLEMTMRNECPPLCGNEHVAYRSYYFPVHNVVDGDLCEQFVTLSADRQKVVAQELDRPAGEIQKKLEEVRSRIL